MCKQRNTIIHLLFIVLCLPGIAAAQEIVNGSFEGITAAARTPNGWSPLLASSSPDTQPGSWNVYNQASHGNTYISMVCRGYSIIDNDLWEACYQQLQNPLEAGESYRYSVDLAQSKTFQASTISFNNPVNLRVWGIGETEHDKEILWESGAVNSATWKTYHFNVKPTQQAKYLMLEAFYTTMPKYCGNILVDNLKYHPKKKENPWLDFDPVDNQFMFSYHETGLPKEINGREVSQQKEVKIKGEYLYATVWDNRTYDGDTISLFLNGRCILNEFQISKKKKHLKIKIEKDEEYFLTLYAHNLGRIPPNTAALVITDGNRKELFSLRSDLDKCGAAKVTVE